MGRYYIVDPYLRFYYRFLSTRQAQLALNVSEQALAEIKRHLLDFIGTHTWEALCREWTLRMTASNRLPVMADQVGSIWTRTAQVDVVGINSMEKTLILGECKWSPKPMGRAVLRTLVEKTAVVTPKQGQWRIYYLGFARGGWTEAAHEFGQTLHESGRNWQSVGMRLLDLDEMDADLRTFVEMNNIDL